MVFQVAGIVALPVIMMMVLGPPPEHLFSEEPKVIEEPKNTEGLFFAFFVMWIIWILIMVRVAIQRRKGTFNLRRSF